jgi:hypothetical protein
MVNENEGLLSPSEFSVRLQAGEIPPAFVAFATLCGWSGHRIDTDEGKRLLTEVAKNEPETVGGLCAKGRCYAGGIGDVAIPNKEKAEKLYRKAVAQDSSCLWSMFLLGDFLQDEAVHESKAQRQCSVDMRIIQRRQHLYQLIVTR